MFHVHRSVRVKGYRKIVLNDEWLRVWQKVAKLRYWFEYMPTLLIHRPAIFSVPETDILSLTMITK
jgi:hypothetical protein